MTDLDVIKGLECCMSGQPGGLGCDRVPCPYNEFEDCEGMLHRDALALLSRGPKLVLRETKKTLQDDYYDEAIFADEVYYNCPSCGQRLSRHNPNRDIKYCWACGQAVKWDD